MDCWLPVKEYTFSSEYDKVNNSTSSFFILNKDIASYLNLYLNTRDSCFYDETHKVGAIITQWTRKDGHHENLIYIRKNLLKKYLTENELEYIWRAWGERSYFSTDYRELDEFRKNNEGHKYFFSTIKFSDLIQ
jgi:hypothetical protein